MTDEPAVGIVSPVQVGEPELAGISGGERAAQGPAGLARGSWSQVLRTAVGFRRTQVGGALVIGICLIAVVGPFVSPHSPTELLAAPFSASSSKLPLGADYLGRDVLSRFLHGGYVILIMAAIATLLGVAIGAVLGVMAGYIRGIRDDIIMRSLDVLLCFPSIVLALLLTSVIGPKLWLIVLAVALTHAPQVARTMRGATVQLTGREFIAYSESLGTPTWKILRQELFPNVTATLTVEMGLRMTYSIGIIASLAFLGFGRQPPAADWGLMINENRGGLTINPWGVVAPIIAIALLTIGTNLVADGLGRAAAGIDRGFDDAEAHAEAPGGVAA
jgi:peptide/nickel transport system permease protein